MNLSQKTAIVVGASHGLGKAVVELLVKERANVFALARTIEDTDFPSSVHKVSVDVLNWKSIDSAFAAIDKEVAEIDILVNCAGRGLQKEFESTSREEIADILRINLEGNIYTAQEAYKRMLPKNSGHIINVSSTSGIKPRDMETIYCASKWGLRGFTESLRLAANPHKIRVTGVYPGGMHSENFWKIASGKDGNGYMDPTLIAEQIVNLLKTSPSISPSELIIERS